MELYLLIVFLVRLGNWMDREKTPKKPALVTLTKAQYDEIYKRSRRSFPDVGELLEPRERLGTGL